MTRDDDWNRVLAVRETDGARRVLVPEEFGECAVARGRAIGNLPQGVPYAVLERRAESFERQVKGRASACEVFLELLARAGEHRGRGPFAAGFYPGCLMRRRGPSARRREVDAREGGVGGGENELTDGRAELGEGPGHVMDNNQDFGSRWSASPEELLQPRIAPQWREVGIDREPSRRQIVRDLDQRL